MVDGHAADAEPFERAHDAAGDLPAVGDEHALEHQGLPRPRRRLSVRPSRRCTARSRRFTDVSTAGGPAAPRVQSLVDHVGDGIGRRVRGELALGAQVSPSVVLGAAEDHVAHDPQGHVVAELAAGDPLAHHRQRALRVALVEREDARLPVLRPRAQLVDDEAAHVRVLVHDAQVLPDHEPQPVPGAAHALQLRLVVGEDVLVEGLDDLDEQVALGGEVAVERALHHAGPLGDLGRGGRLEALAAEDLARGAHDLRDALIARQALAAPRAPGRDPHGALPSSPASSSHAAGTRTVMSIRICA